MQAGGFFSEEELVDGGARLPAAVGKLYDERLRRDLVTLRRDLHRHPELSFEEHETAARLERELECMQLRSRRVADTGLVVRIPGRSSEAPLVAVRGDIDALPIEEETGLPFASERPGVMHACGHDVHASWAVGAAALLQRQPAVGDVLLVLQPAEESGAGAPRMLESGALDEVRAIFGAHVDRRYQIGEVVAQAGPMAAATDEFTLVIRGQGGHGARPHLGHDPIVAAAQIISAAQSIVSRQLDPGLPGVVTFGTVHGGTAANVIPEQVELTGTLRSTVPTSRRLLSEQVGEIAAGVARAMGVEARFELGSGTPPIVNDDRAAAWARTAALELVGAERVVPLGQTNMGGEDFAFYLERCPGAFLRVGAREPGAPEIGAHTPRFYVAEEALFVGAAVLAQSARLASAALAGEA